MNEQQITQLLADIKHESDFRSRGRMARLIRLSDARLIRPLDDDEKQLAEQDVTCAFPRVDMSAAKAWARLQHDVRHEAVGGVYHACTARISNGVDEDLPTERHWGCRVMRVPVRAAYHEVGTPSATGAAEPLEESMIVVSYGDVGVGSMWPVSLSLDDLDLPNDAEPKEACRVAETLVRSRLLKRNDVFVTRPEAEASAAIELCKRAMA